MECNKEMHIGVIGCGFVGSAVADYLENQNINVCRVDPNKYPFTTIYDARNTCYAFIVCVPTPCNDNGCCDDSIIVQVLEQLNTNKPILLKSTVTPDLLEKYPNNVTYNPEFLRAAHAKEDFANQEIFILGGDNEGHIQFWEDLFRNLNTRVVQTNRTTASMIKYVHNAWLATKVAFFHEIFANAPEDMNYNMLTNTLAQMRNIGPSHMKVPNTKQTLGFDGHCFPKDTKALTNFIDHTILEQTIITNKHLNKKSIR